MAGNASFAPLEIGNVVHLQPANPAAGADFSVTVPTTPDAGFLWVLDFVRLVFVTSATVSNRAMVLQTRNATNTLDLFMVNTLAATVQAASTTNTWKFYRNLPLREYPAENNSIKVWMPEIVMLPGERLKTTITNLQVGDQISNVFVCYREFRVPA